jgi:hypothetical protein
MTKLAVYQDDELYLILRNGFYAMHGTLDGKRVRKGCGTKDLAKAKLFLENFRREYEHGWRDGYEQGDRDWKAVAAMACHRARSGALKRGIPFELKPAIVYAMMKETAFRCSVSGIPFSKRFVQAGDRDPWGPSIDRIENRQGYSLENCRMVCLAANLAMNDWGLDVLLRLSRGIHRSSLFVAGELTPDVTTEITEDDKPLISLVK